MKTIILPGFSKHNKEWANEITKSLNRKAKSEIVVVGWEHWKTGSSSFSVKTEINKILKVIGNDKVNIIAKSVGTRITMELLKISKDKINKIILCGIPSVSDKMKETYKEGLLNFDPKNIICFQNTKDPFATFLEVKAFIYSINPKIKIVEKPASNHNYPYPTDFREFLVI